MDNATHALAGMLLADVTVQALTPRGAEVDRKFRNRARWASAITTNLPDLDPVVARLTPGRLGYLLHHRGHSHTFVVGLLLGAVAFFVLRALWRTPSGVPARRERLTLLLLCLVGPLLHVAMDFSNNYGVHPFWPLYDGWLYGDSVFIIEPLFWALTIPALALASETRAAKLLLGGVVVIGIGLAWATDYAGFRTALFLTLLALGFAALNLHLSQRSRTYLAFGSALGVASMFFAASAVVRARVEEAVRVAAPRGSPPVELVDASLTPAPSNPFCWSAMAVGRRGQLYELLVGTVALAPGLVSVEQCWAEPTGRTLALKVPSLERTPSVRWDGEWTAPLEELRTLGRTDCDARAYLRWSRLPFWLRTPQGELLLGDLRYDRDRGLDFSETLGTSPPKACPKRVPPWTPPRSELIDPGFSP